MLYEPKGRAVQAEQYRLPLSQTELKMLEGKEMAGARTTLGRALQTSAAFERLQCLNPCLAVVSGPIWHLLIGDSGSRPHTSVGKCRLSIRFLDDEEDDSSRKRAH